MAEASKAPARALNVTGDSFASALAGVSISTLRVSEPFSLSWIDEICWSPNCGLKRSVQPGGAWATSAVVSGLLVSFLRSTVNLRVWPEAVLSTGYWLVSFEAAGINFLRSYVIIDGFDVLG